MYTIRYGDIPSSQISDRVIVYNPNYGTPIGPYGSRPVKPDGEKMRRLRDFYEKLEESVLEEGFRNPIFCNSIDEGTFCKYGTSRLWIAKKHRLAIPAVIADYDGRWGDLEELFSEADIRAKYVDQPQICQVEGNWMRIDACRV